MPQRRPESLEDIAGLLPDGVFNVTRDEAGGAVVTVELEGPQGVQQVRLVETGASEPKTVEELQASLAEGKITIGQDDGQAVVVMTLMRPIELQNGKVIKELKLREWTMKDVEAADRAKGPAERSRCIIAAVAGLRPNQLEALNPVDASIAEDVIGLLGGARPVRRTGGT